MENDGDLQDFPLNQLLVRAGLIPLGLETLLQFKRYLALLLRWNARINLSAVRDRDEILERHFVESIACARVLPQGVSTLLDFGSGAGFPGIPIALCGSEIAVTLAESQGKKAAFLREVVRSLNLKAQVHGARAEKLATHFDCVTLRAVDRMAAAVEAGAKLVAPQGWLAVMTTLGEFEALASVCGRSFEWQNPAALPSGDSRVVLLGQRGSGD